MQPNFVGFSFFIFSQISHGCCWLPSPVRAGVPQLCYDPCCPKEPSPGIKLLIAPIWSCCPPRAPAAPVPVLGCPPARAWPRTMTQLCFPSSFCCCLACSTPGVLGSTFIVHQPTYSLSNWCAADVWNPRAGVRGLVCSIQHCNA